RLLFVTTDYPRSRRVNGIDRGGNVARHRHGGRRSRGSLLPGTVISGFTVIAVVAGAYFWADRGRAVPKPSPSVSSKPTSAPTPPPDVLPATAGAAPCTTVRVRTSLENAELVTRLTPAYQGARRNVGGHCVDLRVAADSSGQTTSDLEHVFGSLALAERPELWLPDSSAWPALVAAQLKAQGRAPLVPAKGTSIALTYLTLGMPQVLAESLGWQSAPPTWAQFLATTTDQTTWRRLGHPEYGDFKLGKTSPAVASSGLYTLLAEYGAVAADLQSPTVADVNDATYRASVAAAEQATVHYGSTEEHILWHARQSDDSKSVAAFLSVVPVSERGLWEYDRGVTSNDGFTYTRRPPPRQPLVPVYPTDGTYALDNPGIVLDAPWVTAAERAAAQDFLRFATTREGQALARQTGYRDLTGQADPGVASAGHYADPAQVRVLPAPSGEMLAAVQGSFPAVRKRARVLFLLDVSASMTTPVAGGGTRLQAAQRAIAAALPYFTDDDEVGLAAFSNVPGKRTIGPGLVAPVAPLHNRRPALLTTLRGLHPVRATPLFAAVGQFTAQMAAGYRADWINAVVLVSDGHNDTSDFPDTLASMTAGVERVTASRPVLIFTLAFAQQADVPTLKAIAKLTHAHFYDATDPARLQRVLGDLVTSF
ncbi:MAG: extracellular solute-binding protein, partial [Pseudonocardiales bacterium]